MLSGFVDEIKRLAESFREGVKTREFWIYVAVISALVTLGLAGIYLASGFDPLTRSQLKMAISCQTGERQIGTIIVGVFVFFLACVFTLGEVVHWVEEYRLSRFSRRRRNELNHWRPTLHVVGTIALGAGGYFLMSSWCR